METEKAHCEGQIEEELHVWKMFYPRRDFYYRQCIKCGRKQNYVDSGGWYDIELNAFIDKKGIHPLKELDGYIEE